MPTLQLRKLSQFAALSRHFTRLAHDPQCQPSCRWQLHTSVCLERRPLIAAKLHPQEQTYLSYLEKLELRNSLLSDHEMRDLRDRIPSTARETEGDTSDQDVIQLAADFEEDCSKELAAFQPNIVDTDAESYEDRHSIKRHPDRNVFLAVRQKFGSSYHWVFPLQQLITGHSLRQTVESTIRKSIGSECFHVMGNAPSGVYQYKYPADVRDLTGFDGAKVFFFRAYVTSHDCPVDGDVEDYMWATRSELKTECHPRYYGTIRKFILSDD